MFFLNRTVMTQEELELYRNHKELIKKLERQIRIDGDRVTDRIAAIQAVEKIGQAEIFDLLDARVT